MLRRKPFGPALFGSAFIALRDHLDREDLIESLVVGDAVERLFVRTAKGDSDEIDRRGDCAENLAVRADNLDVASRSRVDATRRVHSGTVAAHPLVKLALPGERTVGLDIEGHDA